MKTVISIGLVVVCAGFALAGPAKEPHFDVLLALEGGSLVTAAIGEDEDPASIMPGVRVFGAEMGEFPFAPGQGDEPGFQGYSFAEGAAFRFDVLDALGEWDGSSFGASASTMTIAASLAEPLLPNVTTGTGFVPGFVFTTAGADGRIHQHLELDLNSPVLGGAGIYVLELQVSSPQFGATLPFWFVLNNGDTEEAHEAAIGWVKANLVPSPGVGVFGAIGMAGLVGVRRRK